MPHLDEGVLHAWLDGGLPPESARGAEAGRHLATCPDCRARLEEARRLRERAGEILAAAAPRTLPPPPFEALAGAAGRAGRRSRPFLAESRRLALAATVVLALAAGWIARQVTYGPSPAAPPVAVPADEQAAEAEGDSPAPTAAPPTAPRSPAGETAGGVAGEKERESLETLGKPAAQEAAAPPGRQAAAPPAPAEEPGAGAEDRVAADARPPDLRPGRDGAAGEGGQVEGGEEVRREGEALPEALAFRGAAVPAAESAVGCWRLSYGWPIDLSLPERIELRPELEEGGRRARVAVAGGATPGMDRFRWLPLGTDSVSLDGMGERTLRLRLEAAGGELRGTGRVWTAEGADAGGPVTARRTSCPE